MKKFWIGLLVGAVAVPALAIGGLAIDANKNDRTLKEHLHAITAEETVETPETEEETDVEAGGTENETEEEVEYPAVAH